MAQTDNVDIRVLAPSDASLLDAMLTMFGAAFDDPDAYDSARPEREYVTSLLSSDYFIALAALADGRVVGGLAAYELRKFEQARSEIYIYDLAVDERYRRRGVVITRVHTSGYRC